MEQTSNDAHNTCGDVVSHNTARVKGVKASGPPFWGYPLHMAGKTVGIGHPHTRPPEASQVEGTKAEAEEARQKQVNAKHLGQIEGRLAGAGVTE